jgi:methionine-rich copper-binding protein CopC
MRIRIAILGIVLCAAAPWIQAHAILLEAAPAANSSVDGPDVSFRLRFNSRIDGKRSRLILLLPDKSERTLTIEDQETPEVLSSKAKGLGSGAYRLRWQVLASDGHITRGEVPFTVN